MKKCPCCGNAEFAAEIMCPIPVIVDGDLIYLRLGRNTAEGALNYAISGDEDPVGKIKCTACGGEFNPDDLVEDVPGPDYDAMWKEFQFKRGMAV